MCVCHIYHSAFSPSPKNYDKESFEEDVCRDIVYCIWWKNGSHILIIDIDIPFYVFWKPHFCTVFGFMMGFFFQSLLQGYYEICNVVILTKITFILPRGHHALTQKMIQNPDKLSTVQILVFSLGFLSKKWFLSQSSLKYTTLDKKCCFKNTKIMPYLNVKCVHFSFDFLVFLVKNINPHNQRYVKDQKKK